MGNRAIIVGKGSQTGIYLHWNGGMDSVKPFLYYASLHSSQGLGAEAYDSGLMTLITVINNFFGLKSSADIQVVDPDNLEEFSPGDNGVYVVDENWEVVERINGPKVEQSGHDFDTFVQAVDEAQPHNAQLGKKFLNSKVIPVEEVEVGMTVFKYSNRQWEEHTVVSLGHPEEGEKVPACYPDNTPYTGEYPAWNVNGYILDKTVRVAS